MYMYPMQAQCLRYGTRSTPASPTRASQVTRLPSANTHDSHEQAAGQQQQDSRNPSWWALNALGTNKKKL